MELSSATKASCFPVIIIYLSNLLFYMIDKITDFFKDLGERLSNPLLSSYLIAWAVWNWRIIVGLIFYKQPELKLDGYDSYIDLIVCNSSFKTSLLWPLGIALAYTFIFPAIRNVILIAGAWYKRWGNDTVLKISKSGQISVLKYIALREKYNKNIASLIEVSKSESQYLNENSALDVYEFHLIP
jgi:hypothetical protein